MSKPFKATDPNGQHFRIYADWYDSPAYRALSPYDVVTLLALLRDLKGSNNGNLSLPLNEAKHRGIKHPKTLARSLRALQAVGLIAITRKGGIAQGRRLCTLYRVTWLDAYEVPKLGLEQAKADHLYRQVQSIAHGEKCIADLEAKAVAETQIKQAPKLKSLGHAVTHIRARHATTLPKDRARSDLRGQIIGHGVI